jgi:hypothetical protein
VVRMCANPACSAQLHNAHRGKLFLLETREEPSTAERPMFTPVRRKVQYVWLCESCARTMRIVSYGAGEIRIEPMPESVA